MEWNSRLFKVGAGLGALQLVLYVACSTAYRKTVPLGPAWTSQNPVTYDKDVSILELWISQTSGVGVPARVGEAARAGDIVHITHYELGFFGPAPPSFTIYRINGWRFYFRPGHPLLFLGAVASLFLPTLILMLIAIERQVGFLPSR